VVGGGTDDPAFCLAGAAPFGLMYVVSIFGAQEYGDPVEHALALSRISYASNAFQGPIILEGGTPFGAAALAVSTMPASFIYPGTVERVLVSLGADLALLVSGLPLDATGRLELPLDLRNPVLDGRTLFLQAFELTGTPTSSNGLALQFAPQ
ncbi:MAG: hypothetical protein R3F20_19035, partial [Planctomycetota bacterium]